MKERRGRWAESAEQESAQPAAAMLDFVKPGSGMPDSATLGSVQERFAREESEKQDFARWDSGPAHFAPPPGRTLEAPPGQPDRDRKSRFDGSSRMPQIG